jgi:hypothetical protein
MATKATAAPAGARNAEPPASTSVTAAPIPTPPPSPAGFAANHPLPAGFLRLVCPPGAENGLVSHGQHGYECFREHGPGRGRWLCDVPAEAARHLCWNGGFKIYDPEAP